MSANGWIELDDALDASDLRALAGQGALDRLSLAPKLLTARTASGLAALPALDCLRLWCDVTRTAMRHVVPVPRLRELDVRALRAPGSLPSFGIATSLEVVRVHGGLRDDDLLAITECRSLRELGAQCSAPSALVIQRLVELPALHSLDLEGSELDDDLVTQLSASTSLTQLHLGANRITRRGLAAIARMPQLMHLDLWATSIDVEDLALLSKHPNLESLSIGSARECERIDFPTLLRCLDGMPRLKRLWLDGLVLDAAQTEQLRKRYGEVRIS